MTDSALSADPSGAESVRDHWFWAPFVRNWWVYGQVAMAAGLSNILAMASSIFVMIVYDRVVPNNAVDSLIALTFGMAVVIVFDFLLRSLRGYFIDIASYRADTVVGRDIFNQLLSMDLAARRGSAGNYANTLREFDTLREFFASATLAALVDLPFIFLFLWVMYLVGGAVVTVPAIAVPLVLVSGVIIQPMLSRLVKKGFAEGASKHGVLIEALAGLETLKAVRGDAFMGSRWDRSIAAQAGTGIRVRMISQLAVNLAATFQQAAQVGIVFHGVFLIQEGTLTMGGLIACSILSGRCMAPLGQLSNLLTRVHHAVAAYGAIDAMMKAASGRNRGRRFVARPMLDGKIEFRNVTFKYPNQNHRAVDNLSFVVRPGEKVAILGRIGSGKSTIARLVLGLYEPDEGAVLIDDTDLRQISPPDLRRHLGSVLQDVHLFSGTLRENIALGADDAGDDAILEAAAISGTHDFVGQLPVGYDMRVAERGEGLSGGQKQSIAIARAVVGNPRILVMDEPTSAMDVRSEMLLIQRLKTALKDRTLILVTHRSSLLDLVDRILIIDRGKMVAWGPKQEVLAALARGGEKADGSVAVG